ncbi:MAG: GNAT family N-acetyltransferase [Anaerolineae bacterium]|nr:GNAT family N-acetyltransferase [Anaerolineae bacterium]
MPTALEIRAEADVPRILTEQLFGWFHDLWGLEADKTARAAWRVLVWDDDRLIGHVGLVDRVVTVDGEPVQVGGVAGVYVAPAYRGRGLARTALLQAQEFLRDETAAAFGLLICEPELVPFYAALGWSRTESSMVFTAWDGARITIGHQKMVLPLRGSDWPPGAVDLCGMSW